MKYRESMEHGNIKNYLYKIDNKKLKYRFISRTSFINSSLHDRVPLTARNNCIVILSLFLPEC